MAAKPIERHIKRQIQEQGGWDRILERIGSGETVADIARSLRKPDGMPPSRNFVSMLLHQDEERSRRVKELQRTEAPDAMVDHAIELVDRAPYDRDGFNKAKGQADIRLRVAGFMNRERWGEKGTTVNVSVNQAELHLGALRHREIAAVASVEHMQELAPQARETTVSLPQATVTSDSIVTPSPDNG